MSHQRSFCSKEKEKKSPNLSSQNSKENLHKKHFKNEPQKQFIQVDKKTDIQLISNTSSKELVQKEIKKPIQPKNNQSQQSLLQVQQQNKPKESFKIEIERRFNNSQINKNFNFPQSQETLNDNYTSSQDSSFQSLTGVTLYNLGQQNEKLSLKKQMDKKQKQSQSQSSSHLSSKHTQQYQQPQPQLQSLQQNSSENNVKVKHYLKVDYGRQQDSHQPGNSNNKNRTVNYNCNNVNESKTSREKYQASNQSKENINLLLNITNSIQQNTISQKRVEKIEKIHSQKDLIQQQSLITLNHHNNEKSSENLCYKPAINQSINQQQKETCSQQQIQNQQYYIPKLKHDDSQENIGKFVKNQKAKDELQSPLSNNNNNNSSQNMFNFPTALNTSKQDHSNRFMHKSETDNQNHSKNYSNSGNQKQTYQNYQQNISEINQKIMQLKQNLEANREKIHSIHTQQNISNNQNGIKDKMRHIIQNAYEKSKTCQYQNDSINNINQTNAHNNINTSGIRPSSSKENFIKDNTQIQQQIQNQQEQQTLIKKQNSYKNLIQQEPLMPTSTFISQTNNVFQDSQVQNQSNQRTNSTKYLNNIREIRNKFQKIYNQNTHQSSSRGGANIGDQQAGGNEAKNLYQQNYSQFVSNLQPNLSYGNILNSNFLLNDLNKTTERINNENLASNQNNTQKQAQNSSSNLNNNSTKIQLLNLTKLNPVSPNSKALSSLTNRNKQQKENILNISQNLRLINQTSAQNLNNPNKCNTSQHSYHQLSIQNRENNNINNSIINKSSLKEQKNQNNNSVSHTNNRILNSTENINNKSINNQLNNSQQQGVLINNLSKINNLSIATQYNNLIGNIYSNNSKNNIGVTSNNNRNAKTNQLNNNSLQINNNVNGQNNTSRYASPINKYNLNHISQVPTSTRYTKKALLSMENGSIYKEKQNDEGQHSLNKSNTNSCTNLVINKQIKNIQKNYSRDGLSSNKGYISQVQQIQQQSIQVSSINNNLSSQNFNINSNKNIQNINNNNNGNSSKREHSKSSFQIISPLKQEFVNVK